MFQSINISMHVRTNLESAWEAKLLLKMKVQEEKISGTMTSINQNKTTVNQSW